MTYNEAIQYAKSAKEIYGYVKFTADQGHYVRLMKGDALAIIKAFDTNDEIDATTEFGIMHIN